MTVKAFHVMPCQRSEIKDFIETWHYSHNINGINSTYCFKLLDQDSLIGGMIYGRLAMHGVWKRYTTHPDLLIELRRLCCIDNTPKNTESYFIGSTLRWLKKHTSLTHVISYADTTHGHSGTIYKASNFQYMGMTSPGRMILYQGKHYHDKAIRTTHNNTLKPFAVRIKQALEAGEASYIKTGGKHIYLYTLR